MMTTYLTLLLVVFFLIIIIIIGSSDFDNNVKGGLILSISVMVLIAISLGSFLSEKSDYKRGQVDALTGKIKYELRTNSDSTKSWLLKSKIND